MLRSTVAVPPLTPLPSQITAALSWPLTVVRPVRRVAHHPYIVLALHVGGPARVEHRGTFDLAAGDLHIIPAGDAHRVLAADQAEMHGAMFCPSCVDHARVGALLAPVARVMSGGAPVVRLPPERVAHTETLFRELARESGEAAPSRVVLESLLTLLLAEIARAAPPLGALHDGAGAQRTVARAAGGVVADALAFIEANALAGPLSLADVARALAKNTTYVADAVKRATGRTVGGWITAARMSEARTRLAETDEYVDVIAERVGYADATHFARVFKRTFGASPRAFRDAHRSPPSPRRALAKS